MNLRDLIDSDPAKFYRPVPAWWDSEAFTFVPLPSNRPSAPPSGTSPADPECMTLPHAVTLAALYLEYPDHPVWRGWLWTCDKDSEGHRVYVGNKNGRGLEIHRHLHLDESWGCPVWAHQAPASED